MHERNNINQNFKTFLDASYEGLDLLLLILSLTIAFYESECTCSVASTAFNFIQVKHNLICIIKHRLQSSSFVAEH